MTERINNGNQPPIGCGWSDPAVPADETLPPETSPAPEGHCNDQTAFCSAEPVTAPDHDTRPPAVSRLFTPNPRETLPLDRPRYEAALERKTEILNLFRERYPAMTRLALQLDYSSSNPEVRPYLPTEGTRTGAQLLSPYEPSIEALRNLPIVRTYQTLLRSSDPNDRALAGQVRELFDDLNTPSLPAAAYETAEGLDQEIARLEGIYQNPAINRFLEKVQGTVSRDLEHDEGYVIRRNLSDGLTRMQRLSNGLASVMTSELGEARPEEMEGFRQELFRQADTQGRMLEEEIRRAHTDDESQRPQVLQDLSDGSFYLPDPDWVSPRELEARQRLFATEEEIADILRIDCFDPQSFFLLAGHAQSIRSAEESSNRRLIGRLIDQVARIPAGPSSRREARRLRASLEGSGVDYRELVRDIDRTAFERTLASRVESYRSMTGTVRTTDRAFNALSTLSGAGPIGFERAPDFHEMLRRYEAIRQMARAGQIDEARQAFVRLEEAQVGAQLQETYEVADAVRTYGIGTGIVIASALTGGVASSIIAPAAVQGLGATAGSGLAFLADAAVFTTSHQILSQLAVGDPRFVEGGNFGEEFLRNLGMLSALRWAGGAFRNSFERGLMAQAERELAAEGTLVRGSLLAGPDGARLVWERVAAIRQQLSTGIQRVAGSLTTELGAFGAWDFAAAYTQSALQGDPDPSLAAGQTIGTTAAWRDRILYLFSLKVGSVLASPITRPLHEVARGFALERYEQQIARLDQAIWSRLEGLQGRDGVDPFALLGGMRRDLARRQAILDRIAPELRDPQTYALSHQLLSHVRTLESEARGFNRLFGPGNRFRAEIAGENAGRVPAENAGRFVEALRRSPHARNVVFDQGVISFDYQGPRDPQARQVRFYPTDSVVDAVPHDAVRAEGVPEPAALPAGRAVSRPTRPVVSPRAFMSTMQARPAVNRTGTERPGEVEVQGPPHMAREWNFNAFMNFYAVPERMATLEAFAEEGGPRGDEARRFRSGIRELQEGIGRYYELEGLSLRESNFEARSRLDVERMRLNEALSHQADALRDSPTNQIALDHAAAVERAARSLRPLDLALASFQVESPRNFYYEILSRGPEELRDQISRRFQSATPADLARFDLHFTDRTTAEHLVRRLRGADGIIVTDEGPNRVVVRISGLENFSLPIEIPADRPAPRPSRPPRPTPSLPAPQQLVLGAAIMLFPGLAEAAIRLPDFLGSTDGTVAGVAAAAGLAAIAGFGFLRWPRSHQGTEGPTIERLSRPADVAIPEGSSIVTPDGIRHQLVPHRVGQGLMTRLISPERIRILGDDLVEAIFSRVVHGRPVRPQRMTLRMRMERAVELGLLNPDGTAGPNRDFQIHDVRPSPEGATTQRPPPPSEPAVRVLRPIDLTPPSREVVVQAWQHNLSFLYSTAFRVALLRESGGGNAGFGHAAVPVRFDPETGRMVAAGAAQYLSQELSGYPEILLRIQLATGEVERIHLYDHAQNPLSRAVFEPLVGLSLNEPIEVHLDALSE